MKLKSEWVFLVIAGMVALVVVILIITGIISQPGYYADGDLIDATRAIVLEEDGDPSELGVRIIVLASGSGRFTDGQQNQITELFAGLCESVRDNAMGIEILIQKIERLQEAWNQKEEW